MLPSCHIFRMNENKHTKNCEIFSILVIRRRNDFVCRFFFLFAVVVVLLCVVRGDADVDAERRILYTEYEYMYRECTSIP